MEGISMFINKFKVGDYVIGHEYQDNIPAKIIEKIKSPHEYGFVKVEFKLNGAKKTAVIPEYRIKLNTHQISMAL
jgi:predicted Mrr-cat superfamily restriction endonuclease